MEQLMQLQGLCITAGLASVLMAAQPLKRRLKRSAAGNTKTGGSA